MWTIEKIKDLILQLRSFLMSEEEIKPIIKAVEAEMLSQQRRAA